MQMISTKEAKARLAEAIDRAGGVRAYAERHGLDLANLHRYRAGSAKPGGDVARSIGLQRVLVEAYVPIGEGWAPPAGWTPVEVPERGRRR